MSNTIHVIQVARAIAHAQGSMEVDDDPKVVEADDGYLVQAWVWVDRRDVPSNCVHVSDPEDPDYCTTCGAEILGDERD